MTAASPIHPTHPVQQALHDDTPECGSARTPDCQARVDAGLCEGGCEASQQAPGGTSLLTPAVQRVIDWHRQHR